jgi:UDP-N-acetylglucosamine acyltransferase
MIDATARLDPRAKIGRDVSIGPYCIVGGDVELADNCTLIAHVHLTGHTTIGPRTVAYPFVSLGTPPQSVHYHGEPTRLTIGADCDLREGVTINIGTVARGVTVVGDRCFMMAGSHVAHDCIVGENVTFANGAVLGGHCEVGDFVFLGGQCAVHQFTRIGESAMIGGLSGVRGDVVPFALVSGYPAHLDGVNVVGMRRRGFARETMHEIRRATRMLFDAAEGPFAERLDAVEASFADSDSVRRIVAFLRGCGQRPLCWPRDRAPE